MKKITVLSGKGGVGKSSITASLAVVLSKTKRIVAADCDVDAANLALALGIKKLDNEKKISTNVIASFDLDKCTRCKKCLENCHFDAIEWDDGPKLRQFGCEGCGVCRIVCDEGAVDMVNVDNASIGVGRSRYGFDVVSAQLMIGQSGSGKVVTEVRKMAERIGGDIMIIDAAAGIGCPVIASVTGVDLAIAVTEPTPSGFEDLKRALGILQHFRIPCFIVINRFDMNLKGTEEIEKYAKEHGIKIVTKIPYDIRFVEALVQLKPIVEYDKHFVEKFSAMSEEVLSSLK